MPDEEAKGTTDESYVYRLITAADEYVSITQVPDCGDPRCKSSAIHRAVEKRLRSVLDEANITARIYREREK